MTEPDLYEPEHNAVNAASPAHFGVVADRAQVRAPPLQGYNVRYVEVDSAIAHYSLAGFDEQRKLLGA